MHLRPLALFGVMAVLLLPRAAPATVTVTDCASDAHCVAISKKTVIQIPDDTVVIAGAIVPLPGTSTVQVLAKAIAVDGPSGGQISVTGKGQSIVLDAASVLVTGSLFSADPNGKILIRGADTVQVQGPLEVDSGGEARITCSGIGCTLNVINTHFHCNHLVLDAQGDIIWDGDHVDTFGPRDLVTIDANGGSIRKSGAITIGLARGRLMAELDVGKVDAVSEAVEFCQTCQGTPTPAGATPTPTPSTPLQTASLPLNTPPGTPTATATDPTPTATPSTPLSTASLPIGTPSAAGTHTPTPTRTTTPTGGTHTATPTPPRTPTPTHTPVATPTPCEECGTIRGGVESTVFLTAAGDIDISGAQYNVAESITITAGGNVNLTGTLLDNTLGKCGDIVVTSGAQINIEGATLIDDDCRGNPDVSELNGREAVPHTGFNGVVGTPAVDD